MTFNVHYIKGSSNIKMPMTVLLKLTRSGIKFGKLGKGKEDIAWSKILGAITDVQFGGRGINKGGAVAGELLLGPVGAALGAMSGSSKTISTIRIVYQKNPGTIGEFLFEAKYAERIKDQIEKKLKKQSGTTSRIPATYLQPVQTQLQPVGVDSEQLEKLADLKTRGIISEEEFSAKKRQILGL